MRVTTFLFLAVSAVTTSAFLIPVQRPSSLGRFAYVDESEWYSPPPPSVSPVAKSVESPTERITPVHIETVEQYYDLLDSNDDQLLIIKFYASWCKSCAKFGRKLDQFSRNLDSNEVRVAFVEYGQNEQLCKVLGITKLPTVQMVLNKKVVQEFPCPPPKFHLVKEYTQNYVQYLRDMHEYEAHYDAAHALVQQTLDQQEHSILAQQLVQHANEFYRNTANNRP